MRPGKSEAGIVHRIWTVVGLTAPGVGSLGSWTATTSALYSFTSWLAAFERRRVNKSIGNASPTDVPKIGPVLVTSARGTSFKTTVSMSAFPSTGGVSGKLTVKPPRCPGCPIKFACPGTGAGAGIKGSVVPKSVTVRLPVPTIGAAGPSSTKVNVTVSPLSDVTVRIVPGCGYRGESRTNFCLMRQVPSFPATPCARI